MNDNKSLNNKYQSFEAEELVIEEPSKPKKAKKEKVKKEKAPKPPKEKKVKEPKPPKEKKVKEPKPPKEKKVKEPKPPKEKKVKEPKPPKEKKEKKPLFNKKIDKKEPIKEVELEAKVEETFEAPQTRRTEEIVLPVIKSVTKVSTFEEEKKEEKKKPKEKKIKEPKPPKEKKVKEPKPPKEKKIKEAKPPKPPKEKKVKEKKPREPLTIKDFLTIAIAIVAVAMIAVVVGFKHFPADEPNIDNPESTTVSQEDKLGDIQIVRDGISQNIVQSDIADVFYGFTSDYKLQYYQYHDSKMTAVKSTGTLSTSVDMGNEDLPVTIEYVQMADKIFGIGLFRADQHQDVYFYNLVVFKLVNLPVGYEQEGKALLLATENSNALSQGDILWSESFVVDLATGKTERFLKIINRTIDMSGAGVDDFCILTKAGYNSTSGRIPFITSRTYGLDSGKQDIFIKNGAKEELLVSDVYGKFFLTDGNDVIYMRKTDTGFDIIRRSGEVETIVKSCYGAMSTDYLLSGNYILNKDDGKLYNLLTGEEKLIVGYRMSAEDMKISADGKYLIMMGTVKNMLDYQIHIFNLETGDYAKYVDKNYSTHSNLAFINNSTAVYVVVDPNQGYECVVLDVAKAV